MVRTTPRLLVVGRGAPNQAISEFLAEPGANLSESLQFELGGALRPAGDQVRLTAERGGL